MTLGDVANQRKEALSALADGEIDPAASAMACADWSQDEGMRADWHAWHLIGDVLRSEDLATDPQADRRSCAAIRARLRTEAVVFASVARVSAVKPRASSGINGAGRSFAVRPGGGRWLAGGAVAAGVVLVAGTFALVRPVDTPGPGDSASADGAVTMRAGTTMASVGTAPAADGSRREGAQAAATPVALVADGKMIRDSRLDRYLEAHKQFAGTSALGVPSAFLRSATLESAAR